MNTKSILLSLVLQAGMAAAIHAAMPEGKELIAGLDPQSQSKVQTALIKVEHAMLAIRDHDQFKQLLQKKDYATIEYIGNILLRSKMYNSGVDFVHLIDESASPVRGDVSCLDGLRICIVPSREYEAKVQSLKAQLHDSGDAFYVRRESAMYLRAESITSLVKLMVLVLHESIHAYLPAQLARDSATEESMVIMILSKALKLNEHKPAFRLLADQSAIDLLEKLKETSVQRPIRITRKP